MFQPDTVSKPGAAFHLSRPSKSGSLIPPDLSSLPHLESELESQEDISTDSCDQDYYLPDDNTPVLEIVSIFEYIIYKYITECQKNNIYSSDPVNVR